jgi:hypothetical protein
MDKIYAFIDENKNKFIEKLRESVAIPGYSHTLTLTLITLTLSFFLILVRVSSQVERRGDVMRTADWLMAEMQRVGVTYVILD